MPYLKPEQMIQVQHIVMRYAEARLDSFSGDEDVMDRLMAICPVCGSASCDKDVVQANGVYVHPEDVEAADNIERGEMP